MTAKQDGLGIMRTAELLRRYTFVEQSCARALAGWFLALPDWEAKLRLGYLLFAHAERVYELQGRLEELRGGHRSANMEAGLERAGEELVHAPDGPGFLAGLSLLLRRLDAAYRDHLERADASAHAMEIRLLRRFLPDVRREIEELEALRQTGAAADPQPAAEWERYVSGLLEAAGGIDGSGPRSEADRPRPGNARFAWPAPIRFDERLRHAELGTYEAKLSLPLEERRIGEFEVYFNEFYAAALLATVIYDSWKLNAPRQYFLEIAHHFWDEVRHAEFGALRLREAGVEPSKVNMSLFDQSREMPILHRLCYLALGLEVYFMPRKSERARYYEQQGDERSQLFADVDWSDEVNHVRYGKRWVDYFLQEDARTVEDIQAEIARYLADLAEAMPEGRKAPW